jgi:MTH538 TIR-like domain (DUF1863)
MPATCDLFLTHAWRYHDDWKRMVDLLNQAGTRQWRNFSLPWFDPALNPWTDDGGRIVRWSLECQIIPSHAVVLLSSVFEQASSRKWVDLEIEMARRHGKPVVAVPAWGHEEVPAEVRAIADDVASWNAATIYESIRRAGVPAKL